MKTETLEKCDQSLSDDDLTIDELMEALSSTCEESGAYSSPGYVDQLIEPDQEDCTEDLIAPELLFPAQAKLTG
jgi:hypothetical protein